MFTDRRGVPERKSRNKLVGKSGFRSCNDRLLIGIDPAESDVLTDRALEQKDVLADVGDLLPQRTARCGENVRSINRDGTSLRLVETEQQIECCAFTATGVPYKRCHFASIGNERHFSQNRLGGAI